MDQILPTFSQIFVSSSANTISLFGYVFPIIPIVVSCAVVVSAISLVVRVVGWVGYQIAELTPQGRMQHLRDKAQERIDAREQAEADWSLGVKSQR